MKKIFVLLSMIVIFIFYPLKIFAEQQFTEEKMEQMTPLPGLRSAVSNLPDISVIGDFYYRLTNDKNDAENGILIIRSIETAFQGYIYPDIRGDVFLELHKHGEAIEPEICEAKVNFQKLFHNLSLEVGKVRVNFGKVNRIHQHHRNFYDQPQVISSFFGRHGLVAEGANFSYLLPLPIFFQVDLGIWNIPKGHQHHHGEGQEEFSLVDKTYTNKIWLSLPIKNSELEVGINYLFSHGPHYSEHKDEVQICGLDLTHRSFFTRNRSALFTAEIFKLIRHLEEKTIERFGYFVFANFRFDKYHTVGARYDNVENVEDGIRGYSASLVFSKNLTETTCLRAQYTYTFENPKDTHQFVLQLIFGIGPHSHLLE